jgi:hypothetical protein
MPIAANSKQSSGDEQHPTPSHLFDKQKHHGQSKTDLPTRRHDQLIY